MNIFTSNLINSVYKCHKTILLVITQIFMRKWGGGECLFTLYQYTRLFITQYRSLEKNRKGVCSYSDKLTAFCQLLLPKFPGL